MYIEEKRINVRKTHSLKPLIYKAFWHIFTKKFDFLKCRKKKLLGAYFGMFLF